MRRILILFMLLGVPVAAGAQSYTISPPPFLLAQSNAGTIINNACVWTYTAGTTTPATTYSDNSGTPNSNPIRSDSAGRFTAFLVPGNSYKYVYESACTPPAHGTTLRTADNISAMPPSGVNVDVAGTAGEAFTAGSAGYLSDGSGGKNAGQWYNAISTNTYSSSGALYIGFAVSGVNSGSSGSFRVVGRITGLAGLSVGSRYYITSSSGAISVTAPGNQRFVGSADSTTSLVIAANPQALNGYAIGDLFYADTATSQARFADIAAGSFLRSAGVGVAPVWSTTTWPNSATQGDLLAASAANTYSNLAAVAAGSYLRSNGAGALPIYSTLILPNAATINRVVYATSANTYGESGNFTFDGSALTVTGTATTGAATVTTSSGTPHVVNTTAGGGGYMSIQRSGVDKTYLGQAVNGHGADNTGLYAAANMYIEASGGQILSPTIYADTTATAANVEIDADGRIRRSTSSARYKTDIAPLKDWRWLLRLHPVTFVAKDAPIGRRYGGLLAEEVATVGPRNSSGVPLYAGLDAQGRPDDVAYAQLVAPIITALKALEAENAALRARVTTLEKRSH